MAMAATIPYYTVEDLAHFPRDGNRYELLDGVLLVTPAPSATHQLIATRISTLLTNAVGTEGHAYVFGPGAVSAPPHTQLEPDVLVAPVMGFLTDRWVDLRGHWLAVEVISRSSRFYDREYKRDAYLALGVHEVWLVDRWARTVEVTRTRGVQHVADAEIVWCPPGLELQVSVDVQALFEGLE